MDTKTARGRRVATALVTCVLMSLASCASGSAPTITAVPTPSPTPAVDDNAPFAPGAEGIGDSYFPNAGNGGYDVAEYDLNLLYDPATRELSGSATITATATQNLTGFNLDFTGLATTSITIDGVDARWEQQDDGELVVEPADRIANGVRFTTVIRYAGQPRGYNDPMLGGTGFLTTAEGAIAIGEPEVAATWFPVNDHPRDKATYTIRLSVPASLEALSNGVLVSKQDADRDGEPYTTWTWRVSSPMAPYLATMVVGNYRVQESTHGGRPVVLAVHTSLPTRIDDELARTPEVVDYLQTVFGPYPFDALGGIVINEPRVSFALENQTRPIYGFFPLPDASWLLAHELAHQWFGDSVSVHDWSEIWLNEGFATYAEWLWEEHDGGRTADEIFDELYGSARSDFWRVPAADPGRTNLFSTAAVYTRGGMTLHALRVTVGDDAFFRILKEWSARKKDATATTPEFVALAQEISGQELRQLFQDWLYGTRRPPRP